MNKFIVMAAMMTTVVLFAGQSAHAQTEKGFRLSLGSVPGVDEVEFDGFGPAFTYELDDEAGGNFNPAFVIRTGVEKLVGFVGVFGLFGRTHSGEDIFGDNYELNVFGVSAAPGLAINVSERVHIELKGEFGFGAANQSVTGATDGSGPYYSLGASAGAYVNIGETFVLGGEIGYMEFSSLGEIDTGFGTVDLDFTGSGPTANISVGWMF